MTLKLIQWQDGKQVHRTLAVQAWTDYPFVELGDKSGQQAPIRKCWVLASDGSAYVHLMVEVEGRNLNHFESIKRCYVYSEPGRCGEVKQVSRWLIRNRRNQPAWQYLRRRYTKTTYQFWRVDDAGSEVCERFATKADMHRKVDNCGWQGEAWYWRESHHHDGGSFSEHEQYGDTYPAARSFSTRIKKRNRGRK